MDRVVLQQPAGLRGLRCGAPIWRRWITGQRGVWVAIPAQQVGKLVRALPPAQCGELRDCVEGYKCGGGLRGGYSRSWC